MAVWNMALAVRQNTAESRNTAKTEVSSQVVVLYAKIYCARNVTRIHRKTTAPDRWLRMFTRKCSNGSCLLREQKTYQFRCEGLLGTKSIDDI